jgi:hypothetical protein
MFMRGKQGKRRNPPPPILLGNLDDEMKACQLTRTKSQKTLWEIQNTSKLNSKNFEKLFQSILKVLVGQKLPTLAASHLLIENYRNL